MSMFALPFFFSIPEAAAIIIRDDVDDSNYVVNDADYPQLFDLFEPGDCIGTLIAADVLLTVAHCAEDLSDSDSVSSNGQKFEIETVILHPDWDGFKHDIALIRLEEAVTGISPYSIYTGSDELNSTITLFGRGDTATGLEGEAVAFADGKLRQATNVVSWLDDLWLEIVFEAPGETGITDLEGVGAAGDSGGPCLLQTSDGTFIAGLNSFGDAPDGVEVGQYGAWDYQTRVSNYATWINGEVQVEPAQPQNEDKEVDEQPKVGCAVLVSDVDANQFWVLLGLAWIGFRRRLNRR